MNTHPIHFDVEYARKTEFGKPIVSSPLTLAIVVGMSVRDVSQRAVANLGWTDIRMTAPVFAGDTISASTEILRLRASASRPGQRSEERRVGKECVSTCRSRGSP